MTAPLHCISALALEEAARKMERRTQLLANIENDANVLNKINSAWADIEPADNTERTNQYRPGIEKRCSCSVQERSGCSRS